MIDGWCKNFGLTPQQALYDYSYANLVLLSSAMPAYDDEENKWDASLDANNPNNFKGGKDVEYI